MKNLNCLSSVTFLLAVASLATSTKSTKSSADTAAVLPKVYIVQLKDSQDGLQRAARRSSGAHDEFHDLAQRSALSYSTRQVYTNASIFIGLSLALNDDSDVETLKALSNVLGLWPVKTIPRPAAALPVRRSSRFESREAMNSTVLPFITGNMDVNSPHAMARINDVQASGITGQGTKIAIIDTGVDYLHPSLGGCFGPGCKIESGYDFVGDLYPLELIPSPDPLATCDTGGHGTHVSGIIGMQDQAGQGFGLIGVAPDAKIGMYRVFGCLGYTTTDIIISAMILAVADGADVISMSFGADAYGDEVYDPFEIVTTAIVASGVAMIAATGNDGQYGPFEASDPGTGPSVFAAGSTDNIKFPTTYQLKDSNGRSLRYSSVLPVDSGKAGLTVQILNYGGQLIDLQGGWCDSTIFEVAAGNITQSLSTVILAVKGGGCFYDSEKAYWAQYYGFKNVLIYTSDDLGIGEATYNDGDPESNTLNAIVFNPQDSATLVASYGRQIGKYKLFSNGTDPSQYDAQSPTVATGGFMSNYSSFGPLYDMTLKPQLSAPGGNILSTWPLDPYGGRGYAVVSGTSMSTPFVAACYALLKSQLPSLSVTDLYALLMNSATPLPYFYDTSILSSAAHQGAGAINVYNALAWQSLVTPPQLNFGSTDALSVTSNLTIWNRSKKAKTYTFAHQPAAAIQEPDWNEQDPLMNAQLPVYASVTFEKPLLYVDAGQRATVKFEVQPPRGLEKDLNPVYTGYIVVAEGEETYTVPYAGQPFACAFC